MNTTNTTENLEVVTYADGYGAWVALVPKTVRNKAKVARDAINAELALREGLGFAGVDVKRVSTMEMPSADRVDYVMYREV